MINPVRRIRFTEGIAQQQHCERGEDADRTDLSSAGQLGQFIRDDAAKGAAGQYDVKCARLPNHVRGGGVHIAVLREHIGVGFRSFQNLLPLGAERPGQGRGAQRLSASSPPWAVPDTAWG